jgi:hypothetical protein
MLTLVLRLLVGLLVDYIEQDIQVLLVHYIEQVVRVLVFVVLLQLHMHL